MNKKIKSLSDKELLNTVKELVKIERQTLQQIIEHLEEVNRRRVFADLGYSSLFVYLTQELNYSPAAAYRRISALKLVKKVPEARELIREGKVNLTVAALVQQHTQKEDAVKTRDLLATVVLKSKDEAQKIILTAFAAEVASQKCERKVRESCDKTRLHITLDDVTLELLEQVKALKKADTGAALKLALKNYLEGEKRKLTQTRKSKGPTSRTRAIPAQVKKTIRLRANDRCEYPGCQEKRFL